MENKVKMLSHIHAGVLILIIMEDTHGAIQGRLMLGFAES